MQCLNNKIIKYTLQVLMFILLLPITNYLITAIIGIGRIIGTYIRILGTI